MMKKFKIHCDDFEGGTRLRTTKGERITIHGAECFIHSKIAWSIHGRFESFYISDLETGHYIVYDLDRDTAINEAGELLKDSDKYKRVIQKVKDKHPEINFPINK